MTRRGMLGVGVAAVAAVALWHLFRPERAFLTRSVHEAAPTGAVLLRTGRFESRDHRGRGVAQILQYGGDRRLLRLTAFETLDGPDLQVYLLQSPAAASRDDLLSGSFVALGALRGNRGDQNHVIPPGTDLARYPAVAIWCRRFGVNFTTAPLVATSPREQVEQ